MRTHKYRTNAFRHVKDKEHARQILRELMHHPIDKFDMTSRTSLKMPSTSTKTEDDKSPRGNHFTHKKQKHQILRELRQPPVDKVNKTSRKSPRCPEHQNARQARTSFRHKLPRILINDSCQEQKVKNQVSFNETQV